MVVFCILIQLLYCSILPVFLENPFRQDDTVCVFFKVSPTEFGSSYEALLLTKREAGCYARYYAFPKDALPPSNVSSEAQDSLILSFYRKLYCELQQEEDMYMVKDIGFLTEEQELFVNQLSQDILNRNTESNLVSNAQDWYILFSSDTMFIYKDLAGDWDKYKEVRTFFQVYPSIETPSLMKRLCLRLKNTIHKLLRIVQ